MFAVLIHPDPIDITPGVITTDAVAPVPGARLVGYYFNSSEDTDPRIQIDGIQRNGDNVRFLLDRPSLDGLTLQVVWEDPLTEESFEAQKTWTIMTEGYIPSCDCGCAGIVPIKVGEFVSILVDGSVDPSGQIRAIVESATRSRTNPGTWAYQLGIQDPALVLTKSLIKGFSCC